MTTASNPVRRILYALVAGALLLAAAWVQDTVSSEAQTEREINEFIVRSTRKLELEAAEVKDFHANITTFLARQRVIETLGSGAVPAAEALADLTLLPRTVVLESITIQGRDLKVYGVAASKEEAREALSALAASRVIGRLRIGSSWARISPGTAGPPRTAFVAEANLSPPSSGDGPGTSGSAQRK